MTTQMIMDDKGITLAADGKSHALQTIDYAHHETHSGSSFHADTVDTSMGNTDTLVLAWRTPLAKKKMHLTVGWAAKAAGHVELIENPLWTAGTGTKVSIINNNRSSTKATQVQENTTGSWLKAESVILNPTAFRDGKVILSGYTWAVSAITTIDREDQERVLNFNTDYGLRYTADAATNAGFVHIGWYEHQDL